MPFEVRLDPDDGTPPAVLEFAEYKQLFDAMVRAAPSFLAPMKRFRGPHARFDLLPDALPAVLREIQAIRGQANHPSSFLDELERVARHAQATGAGLRARSP